MGKNSKIDPANLLKQIEMAILIGKEYYNTLNIKLNKNIDKQIHAIDSKKLTIEEVARQ